MVSPLTHWPGSPATLVQGVDFLRLEMAHRVPERDRALLGQFVTPPSTARLRASLLDVPDRSLRLLEAGAGTGALIAAVVAELSERQQRPHSINVVAYEVDEVVAHYLAMTLDACRRASTRAGIAFVAELRREDFIAASVARLSTAGPLFATPELDFHGGYP
jgi:adenine-specific DNA-methyltransferase